MSDEPLFCRVCGAEDKTCGHPWDADGSRCEVCGEEHAYSESACQRGTYPEGPREERRIGEGDEAKN